jgi:hypothetical protein
MVSSHGMSHQVLLVAQQMASSDKSSEETDLKYFNYNHLEIQSNRYFKLLLIMENNKSFFENSDSKKYLDFNIYKKKL